MQSAAEILQTLKNVIQESTSLGLPNASLAQERVDRLEHKLMMSITGLIENEKETLLADDPQKDTILLDFIMKFCTEMEERKADNLIGKTRLEKISTLLIQVEKS